MPARQPSIAVRNTIADLQGISPSTGLVDYKSVLVVGSGFYTWQSGDQSANLPDSSNMWVAPSTDTTGASGAWKRQDENFYPIESGESGVTDNTYPVGNVKRYGATGDGSTDDTTAIQAALDAADGRPVVIPAGTYVISSTLFYDPSLMTEGSDSVFYRGIQLFGDGAGVSVIDSRVANGPAIRVAGDSVDSSTQWSMFAKLSGFSITYAGGGTKPATSHGIVFNALRFAQIDQLFIHDISGDGMRFEQSSGLESDQPAYIQVSSCMMRDLDGTGIWIKRTAAGAGVSGVFMDFDTCSVERCAEGGVYAANFSVLRYRNGNIVQCGGTGGNGGLKTEPNSRNGDQLILENNEIGNGNTPFLVNVNGVNLFYSIGNRFSVINSDPDFPTDGFLVEDGAGASLFFHSKGDRVSISSSANPFTMYHFNGDADYIQIENPHYILFDNTGQTRYDFASGADKIMIMEEGRYVKPFPQELHAVAVTDGTYTVDLFNGPLHRISVSSTASLSITGDTGVLAEEGNRLIFHILNSSGSSFTPSFDSAFVTKSIPSIANNDRSTVEFIYDRVSGAWIQLGAWLT